MLGSGDARYEIFFRELAHAHPTRVAFHDGYSEEQAHWIEAAADMFLMPSQYEPCGLNQMYSLRYGTIPIVRRTGGLADSVQHFDPESRQGTGVVFNDYDVAGLTLGRSRRRWTGMRRPALWRRLVQNAMAMDFSWEKQVRDYVSLYEQLDQRSLNSPFFSKGIERINPVASEHLAHHPVFDCLERLAARQQLQHCTGGIGRHADVELASMPSAGTSKFFSDSPCAKVSPATSIS